MSKNRTLYPTTIEEEIDSQIQYLQVILTLQERNQKLQQKK